MTEEIITVTTSDSVTVIQDQISDVITVTDSPEIIYVNDATIPGAKGEPGESPTRSVYNHVNATLQAGVLTLDAEAATSFFVALDQNVTSVIINNWPEAGKSQRLAVYFGQNGAGNHTVDGWPAGTRWNDGAFAVLTPTPTAVDCVVLDSFDQGNTIYATMVGYHYR